MYDKPSPSSKAKSADESDIKAIILDACFELYAENEILLQEGAGELNLSGRLAAMLRARFKGWNVDTEYQREGPLDARVTKKDLQDNPLKPDIVIHEHGPDGTNLVAIEVKGWWNNESRSVDEEKLRRLEAKHHYQLVYRLELGKTKPLLTLIKPIG